MTANEALGKVIVVGQGYVGLPLALRAVEAGYDVVGFDLDVNRIKRLADGDSYVEDITDERLGAALATGRFLPTVDSDHMVGFDIAVIDVPTPLEEGNPNLAYVEEAAATLAIHLRPGATVILESTSYPGTTEELVVPILESGSGLTGGRDFHAGYSPERIDPGNPTWSLENTPKVVSGIDAGSLEVVEEFYGRLVDQTVAVSGTREAELTKLLENTFRHVNIALVNELANDVNEHMPDYVVRRLMLAFNRMGRSVNGSRVLILGLAYKRNTGDAREAPGTVIARSLVALGADLRVADPHLVGDTLAFPLVEATAEELAAADAVILVTDHDAFDYDLVEANASYVLDTRNRLDGPMVERL